MMSPPARNSLLGCGLAFWGAVSCSTMGMFAKFTISHGMFASQILLYRLALMILVLTPVVGLYRKEKFFGKDRTIGVWITVAAMCQASSVTCRFFSYWFISYADAAALDTSALMLFTSIIGRFWLKERCGLLEAMTCGLILLGIALVTIPLHYFTGGSGMVNSTMTSSCVNQSESGVVPNETTVCIYSYLNQSEMSFVPTMSTDEVESNQQLEDGIKHIFTRLLGCFIAISAGFFNAFAALCCRKIRVHFTVICLHIALWTLPLCLILTGCLGNFSIPQSWDAFGLLVGCTIFGAMCQLSPFFAYSFETAGAVSTIETAGVPVSYALQVIVQGIYPPVMVGVGSGLITVVILVFGVWKWRHELAILETMTDLNIDEARTFDTTEL